MEFLLNPFDTMEEIACISVGLEKCYALGIHVNRNDNYLIFFLETESAMKILLGKISSLYNTLFIIDNNAVFKTNTHRQIFKWMN